MGYFTQTDFNFFIQRVIDINTYGSSSPKDFEMMKPIIEAYNIFLKEYRKDSSNNFLPPDYGKSPYEVIPPIHKKYYMVT